jgi:hypothetical protein
MPEHCPTHRNFVAERDVDRPQWTLRNASHCLTLFQGIF